MVGPVAKGYELEGPIGPRLDDQAAFRAPGKTAQWRTYAAPEAPPPPLRGLVVSCPNGEERLALTSPAPLGNVTVTLLDHHGDPVTEPLTRAVGAAPAVFAFRVPDALRAEITSVDDPSSPAAPPRHAIEGAHLRVAELSAPGRPPAPFDYVLGASAYRGLDDTGRDDRVPYQRYGSFEIGGVRAEEPRRGDVGRDE